MNTQDRIAPTSRPQRRILIALLACMAMTGMLVVFLDAAGVDKPDAFHVGLAFLLTTLIFGWYWYDSEYRSYQRTTLLNIAVIAIAILAIPYYLLRSRPVGERLAAMGRFVGFIVLLLIAMTLGAILLMFSIGTII